MAEDSHVSPLAPPQIYRRSDEEWGGTTKTKIHRKNPYDFHSHRQSRGGKSKCFVYFFTLIVLLCLACLVFALIVLRIDYPKLTLSAVGIRDLRYGVAADNLASLDITVEAEIKLRNDNFGRFKFQNGSTTVAYGNTTLGTAAIDGGFVRGRKAATINVVIQLKSDQNLAQNANFSSDISSSKLVKLNSYAQLRGEIRVVKIVTKHRTSFMNCTMNLNLTSQAIQDLQCS